VLTERVAVAWFAAARLGEIADGSAIVIMPTMFTRHWVETHFDRHVLHAVAAEHAGVTRVIFEPRDRRRADKLRRAEEAVRG
jgi:chromosomal replication initiation ATPase DnaA